MEQRRPRRTGRLWRRLRREPVPAAPSLPFPDAGKWLDDDGDDSGGSAGVREPRHPKPLGPMSGAGEAVPAAPALAAQLPDPRR